MKKGIGPAAGIVKRSQPFGKAEPKGLGMGAESLEVLGLQAEFPGAFFAVARKMPKVASSMPRRVEEAADVPPVRVEVSQSPTRKPDDGPAESSIHGKKFAVFAKFAFQGRYPIQWIVMGRPDWGTAPKTAAPRVGGAQGAAFPFPHRPVVCKGYRVCRGVGVLMCAVVH